jgi:uncharacterized protein
MKISGQLLIGLTIGTLLGALLSWKIIPLFQNSTADLISPFVKEDKPAATPLNQYSIEALSQRDFTVTKPLSIEQLLATNAEFESYTFAFTTMGQRMSGLINIPTTLAPTSGYPVLIMVRGYVPPEQYAPGVGTKNAAQFFARKGYVTIAPDFFGFGSSDPEPTDSWEARFIKPINLIELIKTIEVHPQLTMDYSKMQIAETALRSVPASATYSTASTSAATAASESAALPLVVPVTENPLVGRPTATLTLNPKKIGIWAHSNGGQITLTALEIIGKPLPTTLWAPVTAPFPYSLLFFSDENEDEGKATRNWIAQFERTYDVFDFSLTRHLDRLHGEIQLHHGNADEAALKSWSDEFVQKVTAHNKTRPKNDQIKINYFSYPGADHNLQPGWNTAIARDAEYFLRKFK